MTVRLTAGGKIELIDICGNDEAEPLLQLLLANPGARVDWRACRGAETAVIQVLMAAAPALEGPAADTRLQDWVAPAMAPPAGGVP